jgi:hypothetical protein
VRCIITSTLLVYRKGEGIATDKITENEGCIFVQKVQN